VHSLLERRAQLDAPSFGCEQKQPDTTNRRGRLSMAEPMRDEQADATCQ
jgi:hypothetical protein